MIGSTITYGEGVKIVKSVWVRVGEWAYVKELAAMNARRRKGSIRQYIKGECSKR